MTSGENIRSKRAIPALAIIQGVAAIGRMMIKGINTLVDAKRASSFNNAIKLVNENVSRVFEIEYSTYRILNRSELCECSLTAGNYLLSYTNIDWGNAPEARDGYFTTYYSFNKIVLDIITEKFDIQVDESTKTEALTECWSDRKVI